MATVFVSPGVFTREQDFSVFASRIGITRLGLVGKFLKGPAFEPITISSSDEFLLRFGSTDVDFPAPYVANSFLSQSNELTITRVLGNVGFTNSPAWLIVASGGTHAGATLAVLRSKRNQISGGFYFQNESDVTIGGLSSTLMPFSLSATTGPFTADTNSGFTVSLDESREDYIVKIFGQDPEVVSGAEELYVERIYPHFIREAALRGDIGALKPTLVFTKEAPYENFNDSYKNSITPYVVSRVIGGQVRDLFRFETISHGDSSSREIKISIGSLDIVNNTFEVIVRRFEDTDATATATALERWSNLTLDETQPNFIGKVIGATDESYPINSMFISVDMAASFPVNTVPAGFRGYGLRTTGISGSTSANIYYKTVYFSGDSVFKTYLGISELGYTSLTQSNVGVKASVKSVEADLFDYDGVITSAMTTIKGFHLENTADPSQFVSGNLNSLTGYTNAAGTFIDKNKLKFTLVPAGGFDGFDKYLTVQNPYEFFTDGFQDNVNAFKQGVDTFAAAEVTDINLFATPGIDFSNNTSLVNYALATVENRADTLYVIDSPRLTVGDVKGTSEEAVQLLDSTGIDSSYAATYWPWVQLNDQSTGRYTFQSPTFMVVRAAAFTDNTTAPWIAIAGISRGTAPTAVVKADVRLTSSDRDTLYAGRINPIATFVQQGVVIWGQKTLQSRQSALDRINVRRLLLQVERLISAAAITLLFEQNDQTLRDQFLSKVEPLLLQIQNQRGLSAFKVVMDSSNNTNDTIDRNVLVGKIQLQPTRTAEFIDLTFQVLPTGANFSDF